MRVFTFLFLSIFALITIQAAGQKRFYQDVATIHGTAQNLPVGPVSKVLIQARALED